MVRMGIVGLGRPEGTGRGQGHLLAYKTLDNVKIIAICDAEKNRLEQFGKAYNIPHLFQDYKEMLKLRELDAVTICVPNCFHFPVAIESLKVKKHVLIEKPMTMNAKEAKAIVKKSREVKMIVATCMVFRFLPESLYLKDLIKKGRFGDIYYIKAVLLRKDTNFGSAKWFTQKIMSGGGVLVDIGVHILDLVFWLMNNFNVVTVKASGYNKFRLGDVEDFVSAQLKLENGVTMCLEISWKGYLKDEFSISFVGSKGGARLLPFVSPLVIFSNGKEETVKIPKDYELEKVKINGREPDLLLREVERDFVKCVEERRKPICSSEQGLQVMKILDTIYKSIKLDKEIKIENQ